LGFFGNKPFLTRSFCSKTSIIDQKQENENTPKEVDKKVLSTNNEIVAVMIPAIKKATSFLFRNSIPLLLQEDEMPLL